MVCPRCGHENPPHAKFCSECGNRLGRAAASGLEERKVVTILFCDIVGFTARSDEADPEDVKAILRPFHARLKEEIERKGGTVDKFIGDAVLGVFGAPRTHEDDPERAVLAALAIQRAIAELNEADPQLELAARIGVNTGEAVVAFGQGPVVGESLTGDVVNTASRLQSVAPPGGIVVGEATHRATRDRFEYRELPAVTVKGKHEPLVIWEPTASLGRPGVEMARPSMPMVGREVELSMLKDLYQRTVREGSAQLVTVIGEPGIGKSRIIRELAGHIDSLTDIIVTWRQGRCLPYGEGVSLWALSEIVRAHAGILDSDAPEEAAKKLRAAVDALPGERAEADWIRSRLAPLVGLVRDDAEASDDQNESFTAWRRFFEGLAMDRPLVLVFEDLHWADDALLDFVEHLVEWAGPVPLLIVCAARPELFDRRAGWGGGQRNAITISLSPLSEQDTARLLSTLLDRAVLPSDTQTTLLRRAGGNPLYAEEFVRMLFDRDIVAAGRGLELRAADIPVPETVHALIAARLDSLTPEGKALLHDAAVIGEVFWAGAVAAMTGLDEDEVDRRLHEIGKRELVRSRHTSSMRGQSEYSFWHVLVRDVSYGQIPRAARAPKHLAAAAWLEDIAGDRMADYAELLAHHHGEALELLRAYGSPEEVARLQGSTARFLMIAGGRAMRFDLSRASVHFQRALNLLPADHPDRARVLTADADAAAVAGRFDAAEREYEEAISLLRRGGNDLALGETLARRARNMHRVGDTIPAGEMVAEALAILEGLPPSPQLARAYSRAAGLALLADRMDECLDLADKTLALAEPLGLEEEIVRARQFRGAARCGLGDADGIDDLREAVRIGLEQGLGEETALAYGNLAYELWVRESPAESLPVWRKAEEFADQRGFETSAMWSRAGQLEALFDLGQWDRVLEISDRIVDWDEARGGSQVGTVARIYRANVLVRRGRVGEAAAVIERALPHVRTIAYAEFLAPALMTAAFVAEARGDRGVVRGLVQELLDETEEHPSFRVQYLSEIVRMFLAGGGDLETAAGLLPDEDPRWARRLTLSHLSARAVVAEASDDLAKAADLFDLAAEGWRSYGFGLVHALSLTGAGRCLARLGRQDEARRRLERARPILAALDAAPLVAELDALLGTVGGARRILEQPGA